jgi:putative ATPase
MQRNAPAYDKNGEDHYNVISAFIKSMRGSNAEAALYYMFRMLQAGEDPKFIARRIVIFASEDIGMASPHAITLAVAAFQAVERIGLPEGEYALSHAVIAMCQAKKSQGSG